MNCTVMAIFADIRRHYQQTLDAVDILWNVFFVIGIWHQIQQIISSNIDFKIQFASVEIISYTFWENANKIKRK